MDIMSLANEALITYLKGKLANINLGSIDISKIVNVAEMVPAARECWEKLSSGDQTKLVNAVAALAGSSKVSSLLGGLSGVFKS